MTKREDDRAPRRGGAGEPRLRESVVRAGMASWVRERMLPRLIPLSASEIADLSPKGRLRVLSALLRALRGERARGRAGHWTYDLDRHIGLVQAVAAERASVIDHGAKPIEVRTTTDAGRGA